MKCRKFKNLSAVVLLLLLQTAASAAPTKVGNGDDGADLEGFEPVAEGKILETRHKALELLRKLNTAGIGGLGNLLPEVESTSLYRAKKNVSGRLESDQGSFHADMRGQVYARTFAVPHSPTRFFPVADKLDEDQLIALHIHEGLHRSLPASVREDESVVAALTLAITSPESTHDQVEAAAVQEIPHRDLVESRAGESYVAVDKYPIPENARVKQPSTVGYEYHQFKKADGPALFPVDHMHIIRSDLYPFGSDRVPLGIGIEASFIGRPTGNQAGPLSLSVRMRLWSGRGFDVGAWGVGSFNVLSAEELKNSPIGRDVTTLGLSMRKDLSAFYVENFVSLSLGGDANQKIGQVDYIYSFGNVVNASVHTGASLFKKLRLGVYGEISLADYFKVNGGAFPIDTGRFRIFSGGPEVSWVEKDFTVSFNGRFLLDSTPDANFDWLGNIMGQGAAQGSLGAAISYNF